MEFQLEPWHWWVFTLGFVVWIAMSPKPIIIWLGVGATAVGTMVWFDADIPTKVQLMIFVLIVGSGYVISLYTGGNKGGDSQANPLNGQENSEPSNSEFLNKEQSKAHNIELVGRTFVLEEPIVDGVGTLNFDNQQWRLRGKDTEVGNKVRIVSIDGIDQRLLEVTTVEPGE